MGRLTRIWCLSIYILYLYTSNVRRLVKFLREFLLSLFLSLSRRSLFLPTVQVRSYIYTRIYTCGMSIVRASSCNLTDPRVRLSSFKTKGDGRESRVFYLSLKNFVSEFHLRIGGGDDGKPSAETNCGPLSRNKTN